MTDFVRTDDAHFDALTDWDYEPRYHQWKDLRVHYIDEGPADGPVMLLLHGMPTWAYLYRTMIPGLVDAGYRCIAPDHLGFGRSDKPTDPHWYSIARHTEVPLVIFADADSAGRKHVEHFVTSHKLEESTEVVWSGQEEPDASASEGTQAGAIEKLMISAAPDACRAACEALGAPVTQQDRILSIMKGLKGSVGAPLVTEFLARHPYSDGTAWPEPLRRLVEVLRSRLDPEPDGAGGEA